MRIQSKDMSLSKVKIINCDSSKQNKEVTEATYKDPNSKSECPRRKNQS